MLWFDAEPGTAATIKIERAAKYYTAKYGSSPTLCFVHPDTAGVAESVRVGELEVRTSRAVLPAHFWLGRRDQNEKGASDGGPRRQVPALAA
jgi:hypothetical protein